MQIFLSWSGARSHAAAAVLQRWIPAHIQGATGWMSSKDIRAGSVWTNEIFGAMRSSSAAIILLTQENCASQWLMFEAGCLCEPSSKRLVVPVLVDAQLAIPDPVQHLQSANLSRDGIALLFRTLDPTSHPIRSATEPARQTDRNWAIAEQEMEVALRPHPTIKPRPEVCYITRRDGDLLKLLAAGKSTIEIARTLALSPATVRFNLKALLVKMRADSVSELVEIARREGIE